MERKRHRRKSVPIYRVMKNQEETGSSLRQLHSTSGKAVLRSLVEPKIKGKDLLEDDVSSVEDEKNKHEEICGICLNGRGNEKGSLDCCKHTFCFQCIMGWGKKETKCPICKQRFLTITVMTSSVADSSSGHHQAQKTSFRLPQRDLLEKSKSNLHLAVTKSGCKSLSMYVEGWNGKSKQEENVMLKMELVCEKCDTFVLAKIEEVVKVGQLIPLPLNHGSWACEVCSGTRATKLTTLDEDLDFDFEVTDKPFRRICQFPSDNVGLNSLITVSRSRRARPSNPLCQVSSSFSQTTCTRDQIPSPSLPEMITRSAPPQ
ncbi:hypothetical protein MPTK1_5g09300 [Marchantia polymorpha subsp. ruderalis]|uniref:RING-type domain-containing protein n=1 Tax=Marchantia polymorpha subsp. ruderalis TaxID=1480154 RepID=A0AAF6BGJ6_MARPO|nr:hypothetical protein Mp_5g09300 [Marchantia polymorpha subsp. ruderalis]